MTEYKNTAINTDGHLMASLYHGDAAADDPDDDLDDDNFINNNNNDNITETAA